MALPRSNETEIEERHEENRMDNGADAADSGVKIKSVPKSGTETRAR